MSNPNALAALEYAPETAFAETSTTFATARVPVKNAIDPSGLLWEKQPLSLVTQHMQGGSGYALMGQGGSFTTELHLTGHGETTIGSPSLSTTETLMGYVWGNVALSATASTTLTGGTANIPTTTASNTFLDGALCRIGALGDGDGEGQMYAIATHETTNLTLLNDLAGAPVNGAELAPAANFYLHETPYGMGLNASTPGLRFRFLSSNLQYSCHGCFPTGLTITAASPNESPVATITWEVSRWSAVSATFPSAVTMLANRPAPNAAGTLFVNDVGTATRSVRAYRNLTIDIGLGFQGIVGPGGVSAYQKYVGCCRMPTTVKWSWVEDADATTASPVLQGWGTADNKRIHIMATLSPTVGKQVGFYSPNVCVATVPVQFNDNGINRLKFEGTAETGTTTTNDLTASALRMGWA